MLRTFLAKLDFGRESSQQDLLCAEYFLGIISNRYRPDTDTARFTTGVTVFIFNVRIFKNGTSKITEKLEADITCERTETGHSSNRYAPNIPYAELASEFSSLKKHLLDHEMELAICHGDLWQGNIMYDQDQGMAPFFYCVANFTKIFGRIQISKKINKAVIEVRKCNFSFLFENPI